MNNNSEDISKKSISQILKELRPGQLGALITFLIIILGADFWFGYWVGSGITTKNYVSLEKPKFYHIFKPSVKDKESNLFKTEFILENRGNATATSIHGEIISNVKLQEVFAQWYEIKLPFFTGGLQKDNITYTFNCDRLFPREKLTIIFYSHEIPDLKIIDLICAELPP